MYGYKNISNQPTRANTIVTFIPKLVAFKFSVYKRPQIIKTPPLTINKEQQGLPPKKNQDSD